MLIVYIFIWIHCLHFLPRCLQYIASFESVLFLSWCWQYIAAFEFVSSLPVLVLTVYSFLWILFLFFLSRCLQYIASLESFFFSFCLGAYSIELPLNPFSSLPALVHAVYRFIWIRFLLFLPWCLQYIAAFESVFFSSCLGAYSI